MTKNIATKRKAVKRMRPETSLVTGDRIRVQVVTFDNKVKEELCDDAIPPGMTGLNLIVNYDLELG